jgi:outer membrane protein assembly factor BamD (BamD/ComL family)
MIPLEPVLVTQRELAAKLASGKASVLRIKNPELAIEVYESFLKVAMMGQHAPQDMLRLAALKEKVEDVDGAITTYRDLTKRFPTVPESAQARLDIARLLLKRSGRGYGDGRHLREAKFELQRVQKDTAGAERAAEAQTMQSTVSEAQASRLLALGKFYQRRYSYRPETSRRYLHDVIRFYPNTQAAAAAGVLLAKLEPGYVPGHTGAVAGTMGANGELVSGTPEKVEPPPEKPVRYLPAETEPVKKWLLPLEDLSDDLRLQK